MVKKSLRKCLAVSTRYWRVTDRRTDRRTDILPRHRPCLCIASHGKKRARYHLCGLVWCAQCASVLAPVARSSQLQDRNPRPDGTLLAGYAFQTIWSHRNHHPGDRCTASDLRHTANISSAYHQHFVPRNALLCSPYWQTFLTLYSQKIFHCFMNKS